MKSLARNLGRAVCGINLATLIRAARYGPKDGAHHMLGSYLIVAPFESKPDPAAIENHARIPEVRMDQLVSRHPRITLDGGGQFIDGALPLHELIPLLTLIQARVPSIVLEIGTFCGSTTKAMALNAPNARIHTLDLPTGTDYRADATSHMPKDDFHLIESRKVGSAFRDDPACRNITQHFADSATWDFAPVRGADFCFIDGSHTYEYVRNDTLRCLSVCAHQATILWHDCNVAHPGVVRWLAECIAAGWPVRRIEGTTLAIMDVDSATALPKPASANTGSQT